MHVTELTLSQMTRKPVNANMASVISGLATHGKKAGLDLPHRLAYYLAQLAHEAQDFNYDRELWGPTAAQKRYEGRKDLGNTQPGDGAKFPGRTAMQITGRGNTALFLHWCRKLFPACPDFLEMPHLMNTDPYEGLGPIWFWEENKLGAYADKGDFAGLTRRINGGYNGYADRQNKLTKASLVLLGFEPDDVRGFQRSKGLSADGIVGPKTRAALHKALTAQPPVVFPDPILEVRPLAPDTSAANLNLGIVAFLVIGIGLATFPFIF